MHGGRPLGFGNGSRSIVQAFRPSPLPLSRTGEGFRTLLLAFVLGLPLPALAAPVGGCDPEALKGPALTNCLTEAVKQSERSLQAAVDAALASIGTRSGVFDSQRARWKNALSDSQADWLRFRNAECQDVAPFEGQAGSTSALKNRVAAFEAKLICTVRLNGERIADLAARYPSP
ncbi:lysozyme inhibitor LprI family protein [Labrys wisconsinensis]|uniref:Uncharacterized protein YecT (DUF1311 family) n=1 Tax=Labrys wisconsinensis TaxID=425677 RepID=A0ABU0JC02_9HYPH|nr:lysozyme inhibitor LprI family protein [Labrys wisconsinensis]MDQ0471105.1 uncharacterized protein YecT (DUF1311 family) [Labrys wisconsinensis]